MMSMIDDIFNRVVFDEEDRNVHRESYVDLKEIARKMDASAPDGPDKTLAFRALHLALMHFGAALSRHPKYKTEKDELGIK
jgi:hypothetical protein